MLAIPSSSFPDPPSFPSSAPSRIISSLFEGTGNKIDRLLDESEPDFEEGAFLAFSSKEI
jgi:hypothetical protein